MPSIAVLGFAMIAVRVSGNVMSNIFGFSDPIPNAIALQIVLVVPVGEKHVIPMLFAIVSSSSVLVVL